MTDALLLSLESAPSGSRELSDRMLLACGWHWAARMGWRNPEGGMVLRDEDRPDPTRSVDDALKLLPAGHSWHCYAHPVVDVTEPEPRAYADVYQLAPMAENATDRKLLNGPHDSEAATAALALCQSILKATLAEKE